MTTDDPPRGAFPHPVPPRPPHDAGSKNRDRIALGLLVGLFLAWHVPLMFRLAAGQDEDFYGVPGMMIVRTGVPQLPYIPSRDPDSICYGADVALYTLPPLSFYLQAVVHLVLGDGLGPARLAATLLGVVAIGLVHRLTLGWFADRWAAVLAAGLFLFSRPFVFAATTARPDMVAATMGLLAVACGERFRASCSLRWAALAGGAAGLSLLSHPFGLVPTLQVGLGILLAPGSWKARCRAGICFGLAAILVFGLWLPLILLHPDLFRIQFGQSVLERSTKGLNTTSLAPWQTLFYQGRRLWDYLMPYQASALLLGALGMALAARRSTPARGLLFHLLLSVVLMMLLLGKHPALQYYVYPTAFACIALGRLASRAIAGLDARVGPGRPHVRAVGRLALVSLLALAWFPGCGVRVLAAHLRHWHDPNYDVRRFTRNALVDLPRDRLLAIDGPYVLETFLTGRPVLQALVFPFYNDIRGQPFDYVLLGPGGARQVEPLMNDLILMRTFGDLSDPYSHQAWLYRVPQRGGEIGAGSVFTPRKPN
jgi:Dolichyl-phosphate-mannose-protein mannosyltransferase